MSFTAEQLAERRLGLGASDSGAAVGLSKWKTRLELYLEKIGQPSANDAEALHLEMGHALEPMILSRFERLQNVTVFDRQRKFVDPTWPKRWATVDGISSDKAVVNAKSVGIADPREWGDPDEEGQVPMEYLISCQHEMACTGLSVAWVPLVVLNRQFRIYRVRRDDDLLNLVTTKEQGFWSMVEARTPPEPSNLEDVVRLWPSHAEGRPIVATAAIADVVALLKASKAQAKKIEAEQKALKLSIQTHMKTAAELVYEGSIICTWRQAQPSQKFDEESFALRHPKVWRKYLKDVPGSRRMLTK